MDARVQILVRGIVQGVGFRPFIFSQAKRRALKGRVLNNTTGVLIDVEGETGAIGQFIDEITSSPPPLSVIESVERLDNLTPANYDDFRIVLTALKAHVRIPGWKRVTLVFRVQHAIAVVVTRVEHQLNRLALQLTAADPDQGSNPCRQAFEFENFTGSERVKVAE